MLCFPPPKMERSPTDVEVSLLRLHSGLTASCERNAFRTKHPIFYLVKDTHLTFGLITVTAAAIFLPRIVPKAHLYLLGEVCVVLIFPFYS